MYIERVPNRNSPPAVLVREGWREGGKVRKRTVANLSHLPEAAIKAVERALRGETLVPAEQALRIERSLPHGHVAAIVGTLRQLGLDKLIASRRSRQRDLVTALIAARVLAPGSKLATARAWQEDTATSSLGEVLDVADADEDELYAAMDWLVKRQHTIETKLARRHLTDGTLVLYDISSSYFEGRHCPLAHHGYSRDHRGDRPQIVYGLLTDRQGCPVACEVFDGDTADSATVASQIQTLRERFGLTRVVVVGDRGMLTNARVREDLAPHEGVDWITALRAPTVKKLADDGQLQLSLFDEHDLAEISDHPDFPGERLVVCYNPLVADERRRKREALLARAEAELAKIQAATEREHRPLRGIEAITRRVTRALEPTKMDKHFEPTITDQGLSFARDEASIQAEARLDGIYILRTSVDAATLSAEDTVAAYKDLANVERAFRAIKGVDLNIRPIHHRLADRVRAHVFLCMLAYYVEWHMRRALAPLLFDDEQPELARRANPVAPAQRSASAQAKAATKHNSEGLAVHDFRGLINALATLCKNRVRIGDQPDEHFEQYTQASALQARAFELLGVKAQL